MKIVTSELHRKELFRKSDFSGSSVVIPYTSEGALARLKRFEVVETRQKKRKGINLINVGGLKARTLNGVETTPRADGSITIVGTATASADYTLRSGTLPLGIYMYKCFGLPDEIATNIWFHGNVYGEATEKLIADIEDRNYTIKIKIPAGTVINATIRPMLVEGEYTDETFPEFEAYGVMPSLAYPSEIQAVGDNSNEFDKDSITENKYININNGTLGNSTTSHTSDYIKVYANETYILSYDYEELKATGKRGYCYFDESKKYISGTEYTPTNKEVVFAPNANGYIRFSYDMNAYNIKFERNTKKTAYSSFGQGSVEISTSNKNLLDFNNFNTLYGYDSFYVKLSPGTYTLSANTVIGMVKGADCYSSSWEIAEFGVQRVNAKKYVFTLDKDFNKTIAISVLIDNAHVPITYENWKEYDIQLEPYSEATDYVEHRGETHIMPIQQAMYDGDIFEKIDGVWYEKHNWGERIFDGTEEFGIDSSNKSFYVQENRAKRFSDYKDKMFCNCYSSIENFTKKNVSGVSCYHRSGFTNQNWIYFTDENYTTVDEFKAMLAQKHTEGNPIYVDFMLAEEEKIDCTDEQKAVLSELESMNTYDDTTIIMIDNDMTEMTIEAEQSRMSILEENMRKENEVICENL